MRNWLAASLALLATIGPLAASTAHSAQDADLEDLGGTWLFVEDRTEGRAVDMGGPPMSAKFALRVEKDRIVYPRPRGDERITLDGSVIEKKEDNGSITRYRGGWKNVWLDYTQESVRLADNELVYVLKRVFRFTDDGLLVCVAQPGGRSPIEFALTELDKQRPVFVNPRHDYPQRIVYELTNEGAMTASIGFAKGRLQSCEFKREGK